MVMDNPVLELNDVSFQRAQRTVLDRVSLRLHPGETLVLLGRSGSGKTTLLRLANAMLLPHSGEVSVHGTSTRSWNHIQLRRGIGYVVQEGGLLPHLTVAQNVAFVPTLKGKRLDTLLPRVHQLLEQVGLPPARFANQRPRQLSGGERQRVGVARALCEDPPLLLFDEPFGALDPVTRSDLQALFLRLIQRERAAVFVTHDLAEALRLGTRIALLVEGRLVLDATPQQFLASDHPEVRALLATYPGGLA